MHNRNECPALRLCSIAVQPSCTTLAVPVCTVAKLARTSHTKCRNKLRSIGKLKEARKWLVNQTIANPQISHCSLLAGHWAYPLSNPANHVHHSTEQARARGGRRRGTRDARGAYCYPGRRTPRNFREPLSPSAVNQRPPTGDGTGNSVAGRA